MRSAHLFTNCDCRHKNGLMLLLDCGNCCCLIRYIAPEYNYYYNFIEVA